MIPSYVKVQFLGAVTELHEYSSKSLIIVASFIETNNLTVVLAGGKVCWFVRMSIH